MPLVKEGEKWARVECLRVDVRSEPEMAEEPNGRKYETGVWNTLTWYVLQCECGKEFEIEAGEFKGKRKVKDCGCGMGDEDVSTFVGCSMPLVVRRRIGRYAEANRLKLSPAMVRLMEAQLKALGVE